ncbi:hypothetical protein J6590_071968 [Homalodisca vitripennis]|nr:hypothetical protein J6590_091394 [Homalodisca vitripennis]KAG8309996.1 hypothetical protein J6590_071968 [Homalodisca vitripennis]
MRAMRGEEGGEGWRTKNSPLPLRGMGHTGVEQKETGNALWLDTTMWQWRHELPSGNVAKWSLTPHPWSTNTLLDPVLDALSTV